MDYTFRRPDETKLVGIPATLQPTLIGRLGNAKARQPPYPAIQRYDVLLKTAGGVGCFGYRSGYPVRSDTSTFQRFAARVSPRN